MNPTESEFAEGMSDPTGLSRKEFLRLMGASLALAGAGCTRPLPEKIVPYVRQPEGLTPGEAQWYATAMELGANSYGLLVKSHEGRPTKIEGNPRHPMSLGRTGIHAQAALLDLYDPDRSQVVRHRGQPSTWEDFLAALQREQAKWKTTGGEGLAILTGRSNSPLLLAQLAGLHTQYPKSLLCRHDAAFPLGVSVPYDLEKADLIVSFDADFLGGGDPHATARFTRRRTSGEKQIRLLVLESMPSLTGAMADRRFAVDPKSIQEIASQVQNALTGPSTNLGGPVPTPEEEQIADTILTELKIHGPRSLVLAGAYQPGNVHALVQAINHALRNQLGSLHYSTDDFDRADNLASLVRGRTSRNIQAIVILDANPVYTLPGDQMFPPPTAGSFTVHAGRYFDETAAICEWHLPLSHFLESWSDLRALDGTLSIVQPLIEPLYATKTAHEILAALVGQTGSAYEVVRQSWKISEEAWRRALHDGILTPEQRTESTGVIEDAVIESAHFGSGPETADDRLCVLIRPDPHLLDGRFANNAWLQELPKPFTRLTWGNAIHLSPRTAAHFHLQHGDEVELISGDRILRGPVWLLPGHADRCATIHLGGGRSRAGRVGYNVGYDASFLQTADSRWLCADVAIRPTGKKHLFATTQHQHDMAGRAPVRVLKVGETVAPASSADSLYPAVPYTSPSWGMVIDLNTCTGCGTCTIACQAENNIPVVGRAEVLRGRAMHWIRVDQYIEGSGEPRYLHQPVPCMHCENAPCEVVCPVAATVHDHQGLNVMVYNRCVGTRYCSNNCPYKVRRFNFFQYSNLKSPQLRLQRNPDVTVRERGVMEKCTYCIQRITSARITADLESRAIRDGEVMPACAQACPANAITFGDILDPASKIAAARRDPRHYALLEELNTRPRTTYLAKVNTEVAR